MTQTKIFERGQKITEKRYAVWFGEIFAAYPSVQRIAVSGRHMALPETIGEFDTGIRPDVGCNPGTAVLMVGSCRVDIHPEDVRL